MNAHVMQAKFKVGDRVAAVTSAFGLVKGKEYTVSGYARPTAIGKWVFLDGFRSEADDGSVMESDLELVTTPTFKVGDRVRATADAPKGEIGVIFEDDGIEPRYLVKFDKWADGHGNDGREWWLYSKELDLATLTIQAGRYYKTRDGRRVGPLRPFDSLEGRHPWVGDLDRAYDGNKFSFMFKRSGENYEYRDLDIIAEWPDEPAKSNNVAAQVDTIADEYGAGTKPKFKVGDRVVYDGKTAILREIFDDGRYIPYLIEFEQDVGYGHNGNDVGAVRLTSGRGWWVRNIELAESTPAIVALIENGQPKPADRPFVHPDRASAETESKRLAGKHKGKEFGVYEFVSSVSVTPDHEWQRLAASGDKDGAIDRLVADAGISRMDAHSAVRHFAA